MCDWVVNTLGTEGTYAMNRGVPGIVDDQRSGGFADCLAENSNWKLAYEHYGNYQREGGTTGTQQIISAYPEVTLIHNANTAMAMGALSAVQAMDAQDKVMVTGWGGTGEELEALLLGELRATPMRMSDDIGVSMAEAIRLDLEGRGTSCRWCSSAVSPSRPETCPRSRSTRCAKRRSATPALRCSSAERSFLNRCGPRAGCKPGPRRGRTIDLLPLLRIGGGDAGTSARRRSQLRDRRRTELIQGAGATRMVPGSRQERGRNEAACLPASSRADQGVMGPAQRLSPTSRAAARRYISR